MANIRENQKNGKTVSYRFTACMERDANGKQVRKYTTWTPLADLSPAKAMKAAERAADEWERETRSEYQKKKEAKVAGRSYSLPPEKRRDGFVAFVNDPCKCAAGISILNFCQFRLLLCSRIFFGRWS